MRGMFKLFWRHFDGRLIFWRGRLLPRISFVLPASIRALVSARLLGFGRALGDTLIPLMLAGNAPAIPDSLNGGMRALTAHMALVTANEVGGAAYNFSFLAGFDTFAHQCRRKPAVKARLGSRK